MGIWILWFAVGICFVVLFVGVFLPRLFLKTYAVTLPIRDRAIGRSMDEFGEVIHYEPSSAVRPYIKAYRIARSAKGLYFVGEWARRIAYARYEIVVYNAANELIQILRVKEKFNGGAVTHITRLPKKTDFVCLRLLCVDDTPMPDERLPFGWKYAAWLAITCLLLAFTVDLTIWLAGTLALRLYDGFTMQAELPLAVWAEMLIFAAICAVLITASVSLLRFFCLRKKVDRYER